MKLLIDTNVVLDILLKREPYFVLAADVFRLAGRTDIELFISTSAITDIFYITRKELVQHNKTEAKATTHRLIDNLLKIVSLASVTEDDIKNALRLNWSDFEDAVQYSVALNRHMDAIVTRNANDYSEKGVPVWSPEQTLKNIK